ncbi:MAG: nitroreductase family protein [Verrucomicrobia bacterium]|nr:MAG: nitroreductase family protein [Verrucomicrobiota bacterium]
MAADGFMPLDGYERIPIEDMQDRAREFYREMSLRRSVRDFSEEAVPREVIEYSLRVAGTAPSGANRQPWHFVVAESRETKQRIRAAAEREELAFYGGRAPDEWLQAIRPFGTNAEKPYLEKAPAIIAVFAQTYRGEGDESKSKNYYVNESVGLACGLLISSLHLCGLACLVHTPSPMRFLNEILDRPQSERPYLLLIVGYPASGVRVPVISRRPFAEFVTFR